MKLSADIASAAAADLQRWLESDSEVPLLITKAADGVIVRKCVPKQRLNKGEFAAELNMSRTTFAKVEAAYGLEPSPSDGCYDRETVEDLKRWLRNEEKRGPEAWRAQRAARAA